MKNLKLLFIATALLLSVSTANAQSGTCGTNLRWSVSSTHLTITGTGAMNDYTKTGRVGQWGMVYSYSMPWSRTGITSVTLPNGITHIGNYAFTDCTNLTGPLIIPESVITIGNYAFNNCYGFRGELIIPNSVTTIGNNAFSQNNFTSIIIGNSVTTIGIYAFSSSYAATSVTIGNLVTTIGASAFSGCRSLTSVNCESLVPPTINVNTFSTETYNNATLYVPASSIEQYRAATGWSLFMNIQPIGNSSSVEDTVITPPQAVGYYSIMGVRLPQEPESGIYIIMYDDESREKVMK